MGGSALLALVKLSGRSIRVPSNEIKPLLLCACFNVIAWHLLTGYGIARIEAGRASIIAFTMPIWATLLGRVVLGEPLSGSKLLGPLLGAGFMVGAAVSWALGTVLLKRVRWTIPVGTLAGWQLLAGAVPITLGAVAFEAFPNPADLSLPVLGALLYILSFPMVFCQWAWFSVVRLFPVAMAAIGTLAIHIVGVFSSAWVLGEPVGSRELTALALVCAALAVVLVLPGLRAARARP